MRLILKTKSITKTRGGNLLIVSKSLQERRHTLVVFSFVYYRTFQNGFYTLKPDSSNLNVQKALTPNGKITVVATTISAPQKQQTPPVSISNAAPTARQDLHK